MREIKGKSHGESSIPSLLIRNISKWTQFPAVLMSSGLFLSFTYWIILRNAYHLTFYYTFTNISSTPGFQQWLQPRKTKGNGFPWPQTQSPSMRDCKGGHGMLPPSGRSWLPVKCRGTSMEAFPGTAEAGVLGIGPTLPFLSIIKLVYEPRI